MNKSVILKNKVILYLSFLITFFIFIYLVYFLINGQRGLLKYFYLVKQNQEYIKKQGGKISNKIINKTINYLKRSLLKYQNI